MVISSVPPSAMGKKLSKVEVLKENSNFLREPVATELQQDTNHFSEDAVQILKFHGSYQQYNRDERSSTQERDYQLMLRTRNPGGFIPPQLYLTLERLSNEYGSGTIRATTRQGFQLHGILKKNLKTVIADIIKSMGSTLGACGDLNRNVMAPPAPYKNRPEYQYARSYANDIADFLTPQSGAYYEIWLDGEKAITAEESPAVKQARENDFHGLFLPGEEPIYGQTYMPRKFKCAVTVPGDNSIDIYTQDLGLVVITNAAGELQGFNVLAGGGLGRTHNKEETFARLADDICYVAKDEIFDLVKAIVAIQRDFGDRTNRRHARMKYLLNDWGVKKFRAKLEELLGKPVEAFKPLPKWQYLDFLGWHEQGDGKLFFGLSIENGRIKNQDNLQLKTALKEIIEKYQLPMLVTPHQNIILYEIDPGHKQAIDTIISQYGLLSETAIDPLVRYSMACPAMPTCGLAITESERALPGILGQIRLLLDKAGLANEHPVIRMTGCPNGCARPYMAELGFVGVVPGCYQVWLGGSPNQTRLAKTYLDRMPITELEAQLEPIFVFYRQKRREAESFGDFCNRIGFEAIREFVNNYQPQMNTDNSTSVTMTENNHPENINNNPVNTAPVNSGMTATPVAPQATPPVTPTTPAAPPVQVSAPVPPVAVAPTVTAVAPNSAGVEATNTTETGMATGTGEEEVPRDTSKMRHRVSVRDEIYTQLKDESKRQGKPVVQLATEAIAAYLKQLREGSSD